MDAFSARVYRRRLTRAASTSRATSAARSMSPASASSCGRVALAAAQRHEEQQRGDERGEVLGVVARARPGRLGGDPAGGRGREGVRDEARVERDRVAAAERLVAARSRRARAAISAVAARTRGVDALERADVDAAHVEAQPHAAGDHADRARRDLEGADRRDGLAAAPRARCARPRGRPPRRPRARRGGASIGTSPAWPASPVSSIARAARRRDALDDAERSSAAALGDVDLDVGAQPRERGLGQPRQRRERFEVGVAGAARR